MGAILENIKIHHLDELRHFDCVVVTTGEGTSRFAELQHLKLSFIKGQILELEWPDQIQPLSIPLNSLGYILINRRYEKSYCRCNIWKAFSSPFPDQSFAESSIMPKVIAQVPGLEQAKIRRCTSSYSRCNKRPSSHHPKDR